MALTAGAPLPVLCNAWSRAGWLGLDTGAAQGIRSTLMALAVLLPSNAAAGHVTVAQVADAAGLSTRWTARCLRVLEAMGIIQWSRGQLHHGRPAPGFVRVVKARILDLIPAARRRMDERRRARAAETTRRINETLRCSTQLNRPKPRPAPAPPRSFKTTDQRNPLSERVELGSTLPPNGEETTSLRPGEQPARPKGHRFKDLLTAIADAGKDKTQ